MRSLTCGLLALLVAIECSIAAGSIRAQETSATDDQTQVADSIRGTWVRPPPKPSFDGYDAAALPFRIVTFPFKLIGSGLAWTIGQLTRPGPTPFYLRALQDVAAWGLTPGVSTVGPRSGLAAQVTLERFRPLFVQAAYSIRQSQRYSAGLSVGDQRGGSDLAYTWTRHAQPHFWGIGSQTDPDDKSDYLWDQSTVDLSAVSQPSRWFHFGGGAAFEDNRVGTGKDDSTPDIQDTFETDTIYGVNERTNYIRLSAFTVFDFTRWQGPQQRGVWLRIGGAVFKGVDGTDSDFHQLQGELHAYLPINRRQELAIRGLVEFNRDDSGQGVPFTHLASAGSTNGNRGFRSGRFRENDMVGIMTEWRYEIWRELHERGRVEMFVFFDESGVENKLSELDSSDLRSGYGFGMRVVWIQQLRFMWYVGFSEEETRLRARLDWPY